MVSYDGMIGCRCVVRGAVDDLALPQLQLLELDYNAIISMPSPAVLSHFTSLFALTLASMCAPHHPLSTCTHSTLAHRSSFLRAENKIKDLAPLATALQAIAAANAAGLPTPPVGPDHHDKLELLDLVRCSLQLLPPSSLTRWRSPHVVMSLSAVRRPLPLTV